LGKGISDALDLAREAGFEAITLFEKREPRQLRITDLKYNPGEKKSQK
jgi:hypothetical protein